MGSNRFMVITEEEARSVFDDIRSAYESGRIDVYI